MWLQWQDAYPDAKLYACPGLQEQNEVKYDTELSSNEGAPPAWLGEVELACLSYERNPFTGSPFFNEVFHLHISALLGLPVLFCLFPFTYLCCEKTTLGLHE